MYLIQSHSSNRVFTSDIGKLPGKGNYFFFHYIWEIIHKIGENKAIFGLEMSPVTGGKTGQMKSLSMY